MNTVKYLTMEHFYKTIFGWFDYATIYRRMVDEAAFTAKFVEVGSYEGRSAAFLAVEIINSGKDIRLSCVDPNDAHRRNLDAVSHIIDSIVTPSPAACKLFDDASLDFVWIDGDHSEGAFYADVVNWLPKIKPGGWLGGHDYDHPAHPGIAKVCGELLPDHEVIPADEPGGMVSSFLWQKPKA